MDKAKLDEILAEHAQWLAGEGGERANLRRANLRWADLIDADLRWADLRGANLRWADLIDADLRWADLRGADLRGVTLYHATIDGAIMKPGGIGGPGHILCALTEEEWETVSSARAERGEVERE